VLLLVITNREEYAMYTYLLQNKQNNFETTTLQFKTKAKATKHAKMWASWVNLTGKFLVVKV
jgi:hypothetical protein